MNKKKVSLIAVKTVFLIFVAIIILYSASVIALAATYDVADGDYKIIYYLGSQGDITYRVAYQKYFDNHYLDLTNLKLYKNVISSSLAYTLQFTSEDTMVSKIRADLLKNGFATIISSDLATSEEIDAEEYAKSHLLGIWKKDEESSTENSDSKQDISEILITLRDFFLRIWENKIAKWVAASVFSFTAIVTYIKNYIKRRKVLLFFGGEKGAGKTTLKKAIMNPDTHEDELKKQVPTRIDSKERWIRDDAQRKIMIVSDMIDIPGDDKYHAINYLSSRKYKAFRKSILVIVVAPTMTYVRQSSLFDQTYISEQRSAILNLWSAIIRAKSTKVREVILFINKADLCDDTNELEDVFKQHRQLLEKACGESGIRFICVVGSSVTRRGFQTILDEIKRR